MTVTHLALNFERNCVMEDVVLSCSKLGMAYQAPGSGKPIPVLNGIDLEVRRGEMLAVVGPSGSGKSTLLYCLSGLVQFTEGSVNMLGRDLRSLRRRRLNKLRRDHLGFVFQSYNLMPFLSAYENVILPVRLKKAADAESVSRKALAQLGVSEVSSQLPGRLSGGQQQRVAVARALATRPDIVFADEPTGALDTVTGTVVVNALREITSNNGSLVMVTRDLERASVADRVVVLRDGRIKDILVHPDLDQTLKAMVAPSSKDA